MSMFLDLDKKERTTVAAIDDSDLTITYGDICDFARKFAAILPKRTLIFILSENKIGSLLGYTSALSNRIVPLIISSKTERNLYENFRDKYCPEYMWMPAEMVDELGYKSIYTEWGYALIETGLTPPVLYEDLSLLLPTSGSTGSPKLVRHSYRNIEANAENVKNLFGLTSDEKAMAILPMHYTMGLSVIASHLLSGATLLLSGRSLLDKDFWTMLKSATSFTGVPYSYEIMIKMHFTKMDLPNLKIITQGGGKLTPEMFQMLAQYANDRGKKFIPTYGQSECTARMSYLPAELAMTKICSIGIAEPGGQLSIIDKSGHETFDGDATGEMVYRGENVTLGYAYDPNDLIKGDDNHGVMYTGDLALRDADGCYFIVGRLKRFLKIFGLRIGLDEVELMVKSEFKTDCVCLGNDEMLIVNITNVNITDKVATFIEKKTHLFHKNIKVMVVDSIERNDAGKVILHK
jgi:long-chain acyl-CoA synthetase